MLANAACQVRGCHRLIFSRSSALLQSVQATSEICGIHGPVGAALLANAVCQVRRCHRLTFFAGKRAPTVGPGRLRNLRHPRTCRSRLAGERGVSGSAMSRADIFRGQARSYNRSGRLRNPRHKETCCLHGPVGAGLLANAACQVRGCHRLIFSRANALLQKRRQLQDAFTDDRSRWQQRPLASVSHWRAGN